MVWQDIRLLELSNGTRGLREVFLELLNKYGKNKPFPEKDFFDVLVEITYPEIERFIDDYIKGTKPLPYEEYFNKLGYKYIKERISEDTRPTFGVGLTMNDKGELAAIMVGEEAQKFGLRDGDVFVSVLGQEVTMETAQAILQQALSMKVGDTYDIVVKRDGEEIKLTGVLLQRKQRHIFEEMENVSPEQKKFREVWMKNL